MWHQCMELFTKAGIPEKTAGVREQLEAAAAAAGVRVQMEGKCSPDRMYRRPGCC
jgi:hypothetical protein